ncbi:hypothetical protein [Aliarcobacter cryaerophilus]|jgi:hypothetical protein|uniref:hypothetical protein n=1 Tax=Aliarcobacter cryaerophilus TaxID=28198 RepID=UPI00082E3A87|nr:hypothetical protein [Aliarcobacter cryaerophilus]MCT7444426.1 hypothetical protein [Aliarcobacter cryaerophilus]MCT7479134.1 hypothetical protein [Aliarcobacter cryaerophilus]MCT7488125.1 hypothetical protein [Aliarcobacter cryaerophilus]MCT7513013.1 hypothetical protein [Aliarcobacter cryaerophilus]
MEISNNQNLYTNYLKTKKENSVLPIEIFQIDKSNVIENKNQVDENKVEQEYVYIGTIYENIKKGIDKNTLLMKDHLRNQEYWNTSDPKAYMWTYQQTNATYGNVYEDAKDFENFVAKWIEKGESEHDAIYRAAAYAAAGLLDYGKQKIVEIPNLDYDDKKQHGFHQIDNPPLKKAMLETLDSLDQASVYLLVANMFSGDDNSSSFKELLKEYGVKLEDLKQNQSEEERSKFTFTGDISINDKMSLEYQNFIFDTLIGFFKERVNSFVNNEKNNLKYSKESIDNFKNAYDTLIENFKKNTKEYNETKNILNQYMKS